MPTTKEMNTLVVGTNEYEIVDSTARSTITTKQDTLVSGTNIKTINNNSLLGSGNIDIQAGGSYTAGNGINITNDEISIDDSIVATQTWVQNYIASLDANNTGY